MSKKTDIAAADDEMIQEYPPRPSGYIDYRIGKVSVSYRGGDTYLCGTCLGHDRFQRGDHKGCPHIKRIQKYRAERGA